MPAHAIAGHVTVIVAPLTAVLALVYALRPSARAALRWPLVLVGAVATGTVLVQAMQAVWSTQSLWSA